MNRPLNHIPSLDGMRAIAILIVIFAHFNNHWQLPIISILFNAGIVGVYIFFVLSGFLITTLLYREKDKVQVISFSKFYLRRILRIVPLSWLYIVVIIILSFLLHNPTLRLNWWIPFFYIANISTIGSIAYVFLHYWSLSVEEQYYLIIPSLFMLKPKPFQRALMALLLLSFIFRYLSTQYNFLTFTILHDLTRNLDGLIIGSLLASFYWVNKIPLSFFIRYATIINIIGFPLLLFLNHETNILILKLFANHTFYSLIICALILTNIQPSDSICYKILNNKYLTQIGIISYSIYIWQQLFSSGIIPLPMYVNFLMVFVTAYFSYHYLETPFLNLKKKFKIA